MLNAKRPSRWLNAGGVSAKEQEQEQEQEEKEEQEEEQEQEQEQEQEAECWGMSAAVGLDPAATPAVGTGGKARVKLQSKKRFRLKFRLH